MNPFREEKETCTLSVPPSYRFAYAQKFSRRTPEKLSSMAASGNGAEGGEVPKILLSIYILLES